MSELITKQAMKEMITNHWSDFSNAANYRTALACVDAIPSIRYEPHEIGYDDCANALLKMWMDNVLTDGEYYRIANKLNVKWGKTELPESFEGVTDGRD